MPESRNLHRDHIEIVEMRSLRSPMEFLQRVSCRTIILLMCHPERSGYRGPHEQVFVRGVIMGPRGQHLVRGVSGAEGPAFEIRFVSGRDFSRAENPAKSTRALAWPLFSVVLPPQHIRKNQRCNDRRVALDDELWRVLTQLPPRDFFVRNCA